MIQRVQSLFLVGVSVCMFLLIYFDIWEKKALDSNEKIVLTAFSMTHFVAEKEADTEINTIIEETGTYYIAILAFLSAAIALFELLKYRNRLTQMKLGLVNTVLMCAALGLCYYFSAEGNKEFTDAPEGIFLAGFYMPIAALLLNVLANRFIRRDEKLVRSADRLR